jgi:hypothetical protein
MENQAPANAEPVKSEVVKPEVRNEELIGKAKDSIATAAPAEEAPIVPVPKRKIKWGETEKEVSFDEAVQLAQKAFGIEGKAKEAATKAAQAEALMDMIQNNPREFAKRARAAGLNPEKLATEILYENIELNTLSPEQRELRELKEKQAEQEAERKAAEEAAKKAQIDAKTKEWAVNFEKELKTALEAKKLPMSRLTLALTAQYIDAGLAQKKELSVEQVLPFVLRDIKNIHASTMGSLEGDALLEYIGEELSNKIAAARVARYKRTQGQPPTKKEDKPKASLPEDITKLKGKAYWAALRRMKSESGVGAFPGQE